jgi:glutathione S-transferase
MIRIYGLHTPQFLKVVYAAEELKLNYEIHPVNLMKGEQKSPEHLNRQPFGKVPAIEHNGKFLFESNAIVRYMGSLDATPAFPSDLMARAQVDQWMETFAHQAGRWTTSVWFSRVIGPKYFNETPDEVRNADFTKMLLEAMPVIDAQLGRHAFLAGETFTLADVVAHCGMIGFKDAGLPLGDFKNFSRWFDAVSERPSYKRAVAAIAPLEA